MLLISNDNILNITLNLITPPKAKKTDLSDIIINNRREVILSEHKTPYKERITARRKELINEKKKSIYKPARSIGKNLWW